LKTALNKLNREKLKGRSFRARQVYNKPQAKQLYDSSHLYR